MAHTSPKLIAESYAVNEAAIRSDQVAVSRSATPAVQRLAAHLLRDHLRMRRDIERTASRLGATLSGGSAGWFYNDPAGDLAQAPTNEFDWQYINTQISLHVDAINLYSSYLPRGFAKPALALAARGLPPLHADYNRVEKMREAMTGQYASRL